MRPFGATAAFDALSAAARTLASARLTTCFDAFWNWSNAAVEAANVDLNALTAGSEPAGAALLGVLAVLGKVFLH